MLKKIEIKKNWLEISNDLYERQIDYNLFIYLIKINKKWECVLKNNYFDYEKVLIKDVSIEKAYYRGMNYIKWYMKKKERVD